MSNRIHLEDVTATNASVLMDLPIDQLDLLLGEAQANVTAADAVLEVLKSSLAARFETRAVAARRSAGKDTGIVRVIQGDYEVVADLPKRVKWDSKKLPDLLDSLPADVAKDLVRVKIDIDERAFLGLSDLHKAALLPARTVETGRPSYTLKPLSEIS